VHHVLHVHTHKIVVLIGCIDIGAALLDFLERCAKWHLLATFEFHSNMHTFRVSQLYMYGSKILIKYSLKALIKIYHQSPKKGD
jgi:hypothetical protein